MKNKTTDLPQSLLDQIKGTTSNGDDHYSLHRTNHRRAGTSRKDARKLERDAKKQRKAQSYTARHSHTREAAPSHTMNPPLHQKRPAGNAPREHEPPHKKPRLSSTTESHPGPSSSKTQSTSKSKATTIQKQSTVKPKAPLTIDNLFKPKRSIEERHEDQEIAWLEYQLGLSKKGKKKAKYGDDFAEDGLDELLMDIDRILDSTRDGNASDDALDEEEEDEDQDAMSNAEVENGSEEEDEEESQESDEEPEEQPSDEEDGDGDDDDEANADENDEAPTLLADSEPVPATRYVPPHLRNKSTDAVDSEEIVKLKRQIKGLLNRVSEQNIESILNELVALYRNNRRNDVTSTLTTLIIEGISSHASLLDSYVILHATLVAGMHKLVGVDFAAHFVETCISIFESHYAALPPASTQSSIIGEQLKEEDEAEVQSKECTNLLMLISELYNAQVISCVLVYDIIRKLLDGGLREVDVEMLVKLARNSGPQLRTDDPLALKDIVGIVNAKVADKNPRELSSRIRFMIETLTNLKNNKLKSSKASAHGSTANDSVTRLRKFINGLSKKYHVLAHEPLRVSLADLHAADKKGKWWLVGAAWAGDPLLDATKKPANKDSAMALKSKKQSVGGGGAEEDALMKLAKKQGMNTDVRRSVFVVLMSSDDYVDACERLKQLGLTEVQQREIVRVLVHCCGNEKSYNPYYTMVAQHLAQTSHSVQVTLQYCLWDFLRDLGEKDVGGTEMVKSLQSGGFGDSSSSSTKDVPDSKIRNVAMAYAWWIARGCTTLTILKAVDFRSLSTKGQTFFNILFPQLFLSAQTSSPVFSFTLPSVPPSATPRTTSSEQKNLEMLLVKVAAQNQALASGIYRYVSRAKRTFEEMAGTEGMRRYIAWAVEVVKETIKVGLDIGADSKDIDSSL